MSEAQTLTLTPPPQTLAPKMDPDDDRHRNGLGDAPAAKKLRRPFISAGEIRAEFSHHDSAVARINNGSFGCCPSSVLAAQRRRQLLFLAQPDRFFSDLLSPSILHSRSLLLPLINAPRLDDLSLLDNATTAAAVVLHHLSRSFTEGQFSPGDAVVILHYTYGAVKKSVHAYVARAGGCVIEAPLPFPVSSNADIISQFRESLALAKENGRKVRLAVIDHITSMPSVLVPVKELVRMCRDEGVEKVFVDAAHAIGSVPVDVQDIDADFYTSNLHKWFFCPPSVAFLYCKNGSPSSDLHHPVVSHEYGNGLAIESAWVGTRDYSAQLVVPEAIDFVNRFEGGIEGIRKRNHEKVVEMGLMLAEAWGTGLGSPPEMCVSMLMVGLPLCLGISSDEDARRLRDHLREEFRIEVPIYYNPPKDGEVVGNKDESNYLPGYARISHQVYNAAEDYYRLRDAVQKLIQDGFKCAMLLSSHEFVLEFLGAIL